MVSTAAISPGIPAARGSRRASLQRRQATLGRLLDTIERAGIHGRGGGAYPAAAKLRSVSGQPGRATVLVNGCEGEPLSQKDRFLLSARPETVLAGALAAADALAAEEIVIAVDVRMRTAVAAMARALAGCPELERGRMTAKLEFVPSGYVSGQETALIAALSGRPAKPATAPPYPFQSGLRGRPTLIYNAETCSQIGRAVHGDYDGSRLVTLAGAVAAPGVVEIAGETTLRTLIESAGGPTDALRGVLLGGYGGTWATIEQAIDLPLEEFRLREHGLTLGAGIVFLLGADACPVAEVANVSRWMAAESAGQCGPCVHGLAAIASELSALTAPRPSGRGHQRVGRWTQMIRGRGACAHPDGVGRFVGSALRVFADEFDDHAADGGCERCRRPRLLPTPSNSPLRRLP